MSATPTAAPTQFRIDQVVLYDDHANNAANDDTVTDARRVRRNLLRSTWAGIGQLTRWRKFILFSRLTVSMVQILAFTPILCLGSSHGGSYTPGEYCNPQPMFIYLLLHVLRLVATVPSDLYLGLSPHRANGAHRLNARARAQLERERAVGSLLWDVRINRLSNLFTFLNIALFAIGNFVVFSSTECSEPPADSVPLFFASLTALIVSYIILLEITILLVLLVCALPLLIFIMRALGMSDRLPQRGIRPSTRKLDQAEVDKRVKLVYFTPAKEDLADEREGGGSMAAAVVEAGERVKRSSLDQLQRAIGVAQAIPGGSHVQPGSRAHALMAASVSLPPSRPSTPGGEGGPPTSPAAELPQLGRTATRTSIVAPSQLRRGLGRLKRLFFPRRAATKAIGTGESSDAKEQQAQQQQQQQQQHQRQDKNEIPQHRRRKLAYPLLAIPAHRATCSICLSDFEEPSLDLDDSEPEPLRHLECGHVLHKSCVDEWFTTVSARCPVCQRPIVPNVSERDAANNVDEDVEAQHGADRRDGDAAPQIPLQRLRSNL